MVFNIPVDNYLGKYNAYVRTTRELTISRLNKDKLQTWNITFLNCLGFILYKMVWWDMWGPTINIMKYRNG